MKHCTPHLTIILLLILTMITSGCDPIPATDSKVKMTKLHGDAIGTQFTIVYHNEKQRLNKDQLETEFTLLLDTINQSMSTYLSDSELSLFNQQQSTDAVTISEHLSTVILEGIRLQQFTHGALDISLKPLSELWGFGPRDVPHTIPSTEQLTAIQAYTGVDKISITAQQLSKKVPELQIDLNTIGKGYLVDKTADLLDSYQINHYLIEIGGEMRLKGSNAQGKPWKIGVIDPSGQGSNPQHTVFPGNNGIATSGDYYQYFEQDGQRYSHILNPLTGKPITHNLASVTVIHPSAMTADGLATAIMVLGAEKGMELAEQHQIPIYLIIRQQDTFITQTSSAFAPHLSAQQISAQQASTPPAN